MTIDKGKLTKDWETFFDENFLKKATDKAALMITAFVSGRGHGSLKEHDNEKAPPYSWRRHSLL